MRATLLTLLLVVFAVSPSRAEPATWIATSKTAMAITGDIVLDDHILTFGNGTSIELEPYEAGRVGNWSGFGEATEGNVFEVHPPSDPKLLNGNTLCGEPVTYVVAFLPVDGELTLNVYSSKQAPTGMDGLCASYSYEADLNETR